MKLFIDQFKTAIKNASSSRESNLSSKTRKVKPWITKGVITSIRKRDAMSKEVKKHHDYCTINNFPLNLGFIKKY